MNAVSYKGEAIGGAASAIVVGTTQTPEVVQVSFLDLQVWVFSNGVYIDINGMLACLGAVGVTYVIISAVHKHFRGNKD